MSKPDKEQFKKDALNYHQYPTPGKIGINITKPTNSQRDLSLAYSPGVAEPVLAIANNASDAYKYTAKGNLVAVVSNGTAILGLGNLGGLASKPVMEGKGVLFKRFANVDVFDIEVETTDVEEFITTVKNIAPTFGGINLEDIKAPECFEIETRLKKLLDIPVFHDDQHGTAIVASAALLNGLEIQGKQLADAKVVCLGAGAAAIATCDLLLNMGLKRENVYMLDRQGVIHQKRDSLTSYKAKYAQVNDDIQTLSQAMENADIFIGLSGPNLVTEEDLKKMAPNPVVFALSNPDPEIHPDVVNRVRDDVIMATGRSDLPNQVNNVLCFPYMFRGALDVRAHTINAQMCIAAVEAIRQLAKEPVPQEIVDLYPDITALSFGPDYILPKPMDPRLLENVPTAVAKAAIESGVADAQHDQS